MGIRQPGVKRRQANLGAIANQQENKSEVEKRDVELWSGGLQQVPGHGGRPFAKGFLASKIDQDGAEECKRDADACEDEILP